MITNTTIKKDLCCSSPPNKKSPDVTCLKTNTEALLNNMAKKKGKYNLDEFERFVKEDIYSISGKKPIIKIAEME